MTNGNGTDQTQAQQLDRAMRQRLIADDTMVGLPPTREAIIEQGLRIQQETAAERDELRREVNGLKADITAYKVMVEALQAQLAEADSRVASMVVTRDDAVRRQAEVETVLASMLALGRAFQIKSAPLITGEGDHEDISSMSANDRRIAQSGYRHPSDID